MTMESAMSHQVSIIGLGVMGQRMLTNMTAHAKFTVVAAWDPDATACARTRERFPRVRIADSAADAIADPRSTVVYIASPPIAHREHALSAFAQGKSVYCEKPLGVDVTASTELVKAADTFGCVNIVNFSLACAAATSEVERQLASNELGEVVGVDIRLHFSQWPRAWQMDAASWLSLRAEGGFAREVLSHWLYLTERLFGEAVLDAAHVTYPAAAAHGRALAETHLLARLSVGSLPVTVAGSIGGAGPDRIEYTVWGQQRSCRIYDWNQLLVSDGASWQEALTHVADARATGYTLQLDNAAAAFSGQPHGMPCFDDALRVQVLIEALLAS
jgi:1,5-anhydro-D-fructose reductase (1,5-anhydro-D-mannitol-forming)